MMLRADCSIIVRRCVMGAALFCCIGGSVRAQSVKDSVLKGVRIEAKHKSADARLDFTAGQKQVAIDTAALQQYRLQSIASLLSSQLPVFIRSYSFNGLSTLSFRGASAAQSQVLWNGVPIQNGALGLTDVSLLPVSLLSSVRVLYGGSGALLGSGNVGGALLVGSDAPIFDTGRVRVAAMIGAGSFAQYQGGIKVQVSRRRWYYAVNVFTQYGVNDFRYTAADGHMQNMANNRMEGNAGTLQVAYKIADGNIISFTGWMQQYVREIPPALFESYSVKWQVDGSLRLLGDWHRSKANNYIYAKSSFIRDLLSYTDSAVALSTDNLVYQYYQEVGWRHTFNHSRLLLFSPVQVSWLDQPVTGDRRSQTKVALAGAYDLALLHNRLDVSISAREELINKTMVFLPGAGVSYDLFRWLSLRAGVQRSYRTPSLNELYYVPGGNADLKHEEGRSADAGYNFKWAHGLWAVHHDLSVFDRDINNWILWLGGAIWTPHNIAEVHSRGVETENSVDYKVGKTTLRLGFNTSYVLATTVSSYIPGDGSVGKQIPYVPRYNARANAGIYRPHWSLSYTHAYTGYRFITSDESEYLSPYQVGNISAMYHTYAGHWLVRLSAQVNNVWNQQYAVVAFRPMPGTNVLFGVSIGSR